MKIAIVLLLGLSALCASNPASAQSQPNGPAASDPDWPRQKTTDQGSLVYYQPQVDDWKDFKQIDFRMAFSLTPKGQKEVVGVLSVQAQTAVNVDQHDVVLTNFKITQVYLPSVDPEKKGPLEELVRGFLPSDYLVAMSLDRLVADVNKAKTAPTVKVQNDPPTIFVSYTPAILLQVDGEPTRANIADTDLGFIVNSNFPLFFQTDATKDFYLYTGAQWLKSASIEGPWTPAPKLPGDFSKVANNPKWADMKQPIQSPSATGKPPTIFYSNKPAEVMLFEGNPAYAKIPGTELSYATNTDCDLFLDATTKQYYYLVAGRWFRAADLQGPWTYATPDLPADFAKIPQGSPAARVLVSVPGTEEAEDAVLLAQVPTTAVVSPKAAEQVKVTYTGGNPEFKPIQGTSLEYATNTPDKVIKVGDVDYLCLQGVWFMSSSPQGPWTTAPSVPPEIYQIPPSSPVYNVTYVTQSTNSAGVVSASYTAGYLGTFVAGAVLGAILADGTGYYYPPYIGYPAYGYPIYRPYAATYGVGSFYNPYTGAYGAGRGVYGPYRGAAAGASYNPYTGTYARGATAYGPYGSRSVGQAYNPYTGTYAATRQGSSPYALGASPSYLKETDRPMLSTFRLRMVLWDRSRVPKAEPQLALRPSTGTPPWRRPPAVTCMPRTMATFIRIPVQVGTSTTMATGIRFRNPQRTLKNVRKAPRVRTDLAVRLRRSNEPKIVRGPKIPRETCHKEASIGRAALASAVWIRISRTATVGNFRVSVLIASKGAEAAGAVLSEEGDAALAVGDARI